MQSVLDNPIRPNLLADGHHRFETALAESPTANLVRDQAVFRNPDVEVAYKGAAKEPMRARVASPEERARLWPVIAGDFKNYAGYQTKTTREIPLVLLEPPS